MTGLHILTASCLVAISLLDRSLLKRREIKINDVKLADNSDQYIRFVLDFSIKQKLQNAAVTYTLRDKNNPATVVTGKARTLEFSKIGDNSEYLLINKKLVKSGTWDLDVKVISSGSRINPFYKLFPITTTLRKEFLIK